MLWYKGSLVVVVVLVYGIPMTLCKYLWVLYGMKCLLCHLMTDIDLMNKGRGDLVNVGLWDCETVTWWGWRLERDWLVTTAGNYILTTSSQCTVYTLHHSTTPRALNRVYTALYKCTHNKQIFQTSWSSWDDKLCSTAQIWLQLAEIETSRVFYLNVF